MNPTFRDHGIEALSRPIDTADVQMGAVTTPSFLWLLSTRER